jgi:hypothetical protein
MELFDNFLERIKSEKQFRETIIDSLCHGIKESSQFRDTIEYVIENKLDTIQQKTDVLYEDEEDILVLILPSIRRVWGKVFVETPKIFEMPKVVTQVPGYVPDKRLELYQLSFNINDFVDYLIDMFVKSNNLLKDFEYLDKTQETLTLIVDNYVAKLINGVTTCNDIELEIERLKKELQRENSLKEILGDD